MLDTQVSVEMMRNPVLKYLNKVTSHGIKDVKPFEYGSCVVPVLFVLNNNDSVYVSYLDNK